MGEHEGLMVHLCCDLTAVSNSGRLKRSDVSEDNRDGCVDMRQLQCQTQGKNQNEDMMCVRKSVHLVHQHWFILWLHICLDFQSIKYNISAKLRITC